MVTPAKKIAGKPAAQPREMTYLESDEEIRQALQARRAAATQQTTKAQQAGKAVPLAKPVEPEPKLERPAQRPPTGLLCILDDGKAEGEWVRLRADRTVIGRAEGDIQIPHDVVMSRQHAEITRQRLPTGAYRWLLTDLKSANGSFVRVGKTVLRHNQELVLGSGRFRFESGSAAATAAAEPTSGPQGTTQAWSGPAMNSLVSAFVEITAAGHGERFPLTLPEYWLGRDPKTCGILRQNDELLNARHARLFRDANGLWHIENNKSLNGMWLRIEEIPLLGACHFRLGEQRFLFRV
jgi:pSer/pThr/pTyr-binding forkhead associated (FHA) protein